MTIKEVIDYLESIAPPYLQESYDNAGLIVGNPFEEVKGILCCLDSVEAIVEEAIKLGCNLIVAHHPIIFRGLKKLNGKTYVERTVMQAIKNDIAIFAIHTNLDNVYENGVNGKIAERLGLLQTEILAPKKVILDEDNAIGSGMIGFLEKPMEALDFLNYLKTTMQVGCVKYTQLLDKQIHKVAVCGGSGGFLLNKAIAQKADIFITSDYKYHEFFDADGKIVIADIGHFESEQFTIELLHQLISQKFPNFATHFTKVNTNPVKYLC